MKVSDFLNHCYLHDSLVSEIIHMPEEKKVVLRIELCNWQQIDYDESNDPEVIEGDLIFQGVERLELDCVKDISCDGILEVKVISSNGHTETVKIIADGVNIVTIEARNVMWLPNH